MPRLEKCMVPSCLKATIYADIDECRTEGSCPVNSNCSNTIGSYSCICDIGFIFNGSDCIDIDECHHSPCHVNSSCINIIGHFYCICKEGFSGESFDCQSMNMYYISVHALTGSKFIV